MPVLSVCRSSGLRELSLCRLQATSRKPAFRCFRSDFWADDGNRARAVSQWNGFAACHAMVSKREAFELSADEQQLLAHARPADFARWRNLSEEIRAPRVQCGGRRVFVGRAE